MPNLALSILRQPAQSNFLLHSLLVFYQFISDTYLKMTATNHGGNFLSNQR